MNTLPQPADVTAERNAAVMQAYKFIRYVANRHYWRNADDVAHDAVILFLRYWKPEKCKSGKPLAFARFCLRHAGSKDSERYHEREEKRRNIELDRLTYAPKSQAPLDADEVERVHAAVATLAPEARKLIIDRFGLNGEKPAIRPKLAIELGMTRQGVAYRQSRSMERLRNALRE